MNKNRYSEVDTEDDDGLSSQSGDARGARAGGKKKVAFAGYQEGNEGRNLKSSFLDGQYKARCDFSLMSNYILYIIFTT